MATHSSVLAWDGGAGKVKVKSLSGVQFFASDPMNCSLPASSVHGIFQAIVLEWGFLSRADQGIGVFWHAAPPTRLCLEFPSETCLILRCAGKVGNPFQT